MRGTVGLLVVVLATHSCAARKETPDVGDVAGRIEERTGARPRSTADTTNAANQLPPGVSLDDGLTQTEAVAVALWNNAAFQASLTELGFARADLADAGLLRNPVLSLLFPVGPTGAQRHHAREPLFGISRRSSGCFGRELVLRGAEERLAPILMTALVTALALIPIVVGGSRAGQEVEHPMAVVIVGGLFTSTVLNLFLLPAIFLRYGQSRPSPGPSPLAPRPFANG